MNDREKLIALLKENTIPEYWAEMIADHLLANGVTIQRWIPVTERLPKNDTGVLVYRPTMVKKIILSYFYNSFREGALDICGNEVITHWMPLPDPPIEEQSRGGASHAVIANKILDEQPAIDAVPVVRCEKCKHNNERHALMNGGVWCEYWGTDPDNDDFCSRGERRRTDEA